MATRRRRARLALQPQAGTFHNRSTGEQVAGVMLLMKGAPTRGQWWVGGQQIALITWADGRRDRQTGLYNRVRRAVLAHGEEAAAHLRQDPAVDVLAA